MSRGGMARAVRTGGDRRRQDERESGTAPRWRRFDGSTAMTALPVDT